MLETDGIIVTTVTGNFDINVIIFTAKPKTSFFGVTKRMLNTLHWYLMMVIDLIFHAGLVI